MANFSFCLNCCQFIVLDCFSVFCPSVLAISLSFGCRHTMTANSYIYATKIKTFAYTAK